MLFFFVVLVMRLGKKKEKEKDSEPKNQVIDSVLRLICSPKTQHYPLTSNLSPFKFFILTVYFIITLYSYYRWV